MTIEYSCIEGCGNLVFNRCPPWDGNVDISDAEFKIIFEAAKSFFHEKELIETSSDRFIRRRFPIGRAKGEIDTKE